MAERSDVANDDTPEMMAIADDPADWSDAPENSLVPFLTDLGGGIRGEVPRGVNRHLAAVLSWALLPFYVTIGPVVRAKAMRMAPPPGPYRGHIPGAGAPIRLLVIGDSSAASVGVTHTKDGLAARVADGIAQRTGRPVSHVAYGNNSATAADVRDHVVPHLPNEPFTHIVVSIGANDAKNFHSAGRWKKGFGTLLYALRTRYPEARIVWSRLFRFSHLPAIPAPLGWVLDMRRVVVNRIADELCIERGAHAAPPMAVTNAKGLSLDGFHASALGYRMWGRHLAEYIATLETEPRRAPTLQSLLVEPDEVPEAAQAMAPGKEVARA